MDIDITCIEAFEYFNDSIDGQLDPSMKSALETHLSKCNLCRLEHALTLGSRSSVRRYMKRVDTPPVLRRQILRSLAADAAPGAKPATRAAGFLGFTGWRIPLAFGGALALALLTLFVLQRKPGHTHTKPFDGSVVTESFNHFDEVLDGRLQPDIRSNNPLVVQKYLAERVHFPVRMPPMRQFRLVGAHLTTADDETTAHVIYERDGEIVYVSLSDARSLLHSTHRFIPGPVLSAISGSGVYTTTGKLTDCTMAMWLSDSTLCTAIADIKQDLLLANITESDIP
jgi:anti-sigma factor RsiW